MPLHRRGLLSVALAAGLLPLARANVAPAEVSGRWPQARLVGRAQLRFMGLRIYEARLWAPGPVSAEGWATHDFALELQYARSLDGPRIAERSLDEMRRQGPIDATTAERWLATLKASFPDVRDGDRLTGEHRPGEGARLYFNGQLQQTWSDAELARRFFGIWLSPQTSDLA